MRDQKHGRKPYYKKNQNRTQNDQVKELPGNQDNQDSPEKEDDGLIYGRNTVLSYLENEQKADKSSINKLFLLSSAGQDPRLKEIQQIANKLKVQVHPVNREKLDSLTAGNHQGVIASLSPVEMLSLEDLEEIIETAKSEAAARGADLSGYTIVAVDGVEDPRNLGAIIRTAEAEGAKAVVIPERRAASVTGSVAKTSAGAIAHIPIVRVTNMVRSLNRLKELGFWVLGMSPAARDHIYRMDLKCPVVLVVGSEGKGMSRLVSENCDLLGSIPSLGKTESLNVSVALGIGLYEIVRQNHQ
ncbi:MAG TPA: 23S rRNA (guanosine(2251)-2'-O)-methyltransferase RlmB [Candidatus Melainabacteria bacterium]|nr:23S rRNA (guanosine(2251)-2'-O)-methyltransferase RlmB [Candidatus Melainabacteria bacterium]